MGFWRFVTLGIICALSFGVMPTSAAQVFNQDHSIYLQAQTALSKRHYKTYRRLEAQLQEHPLLPYLHLRWITKHFYTKPTADIDEFFQLYDGQPVAAILQRRWIKYLARKKDWPLFLSYYQPANDKNLKLRCHKVTALQHSNKHFDAILEGQALWLLGDSLPKACDSVYKKWEKLGYLSQDLIWQRLLRAQDKKNYRLARYLKKKLSKDKQKDAYAFQKLWRQPSSLVTHSDLVTLPVDARFLLLRRAMKYNPSQVMSNKIEGALRGLDQTQIAEIKTTAVENAALKGLVDYNWFEMGEQIGHMSIDTYEAFLVGTVKTENWPWFSHLYKVAPEGLKVKAKWQYWKARALESLGASWEQAKPFYQLASTSRDYYGFMSCQHLGIGAVMNHTPVNTPPSLLQKTRMNPAVQRAVAFYEIGEPANARREWQHAVTHADDETKDALALLAGRMDWSDRAILTLAQNGNWHDLQLRFPLAHEPIIDKAASRARIEKSWVYGITRQESAFIQDARSPVGATGLMQLMPATARSVSKKLRLRYSKKRLLDPNYNVRIGSQYMRSLLSQYKGNKVLATAAYNAGPGAVNRWLKNFDGPLDIWIERIPYKETREYVQKVLAYSTIYSYRLGQLQPILDDRTLLSWAEDWGTPIYISRLSNRQNDRG